jgi:hypothetical protein
MREHWHDSELDGLDEPAAATVRAFPAPGRPARLHSHAASGPLSAGDEPWHREQGLRWPPAGSWGTGPEDGDAATGRRAGALDSPVQRSRLIAGATARGGVRDKRDRLDDLDNTPKRARNSYFSRRYGAARGVASRKAGRFAAEWSASRTSSRSSRPDALVPRRLRCVKKDGGVMARRALLERSAELTAEYEVPPRQPHSVRPAQATAHWRGAGGRWLIWVARAIAWAVLLLIGYRGVLAIVQGPAARTPAASSQLQSASTQFPVTAAEAYALQFGDVYLNFSPASAAARNQDVAKFLPPGAGTSLGIDAAGTLHMVDEQVASVSVTGTHTAIVTLLARLSSGRLIELGVPIYATASGMSVSGYPALLPGPAKAVPRPVGQQTSDQVTETALQAQLPAFFEAYASGDQGTLARFTAPGAHITGLHEGVSFGGIDSVYVPAGGLTRQIAVTVTWKLPSAAATTAKSSAPGAGSATLQTTYQMTVVRKDGSWDIRSIGASTRALAQGPP